MLRVSTLKLCCRNICWGGGARKHMSIVMRPCVPSTNWWTCKQSATLLSHRAITLAEEHESYHSTKSNNSNQPINIDKVTTQSENLNIKNNFAALQNLMQEDEELLDLYHLLCEYIVRGNATAASEYARLLTEQITNKKHLLKKHINNTSIDEEEMISSSEETDMHNRATAMTSTRSTAISARSLLTKDDVDSSKKDDDNQVNDDMPQPRHDDVEDAIRAAEREFRRNINNTTDYDEDASTGSIERTEHDAFTTLLTCSKQLCITIIETAFEAVDPSNTKSSDADQSHCSATTTADAVDAVSKENSTSTSDVNESNNNIEETIGLCNKTPNNAEVINDNTPDTRSNMHTRILNEYLTKEAVKWKAQKNAIAKVILDTAQRLHITPLSLLQAEQTFHTFAEANTNSQELYTKAHYTTQATSQWRLWKHCNVVVRGELPETAHAILGQGTSSDCNHNNTSAKLNNVQLQTAVDRELEMLKRRLARQGIAFSRDDEHIARVELCLRHCTMRYVVGIHRELQFALDNDEGLHRYLKEHKTFHSRRGVQSGSELFIQEVMEALNTVPSSLVASFEHISSESKYTLKDQILHEGQLHKQQEESKNKQTQQLTNCNKDHTTCDDESDELLRQTLATPVIPYTFMLKCCLWFDIPRSD